MSLKNFQFNSDYPMDKIVLLREFRVAGTSATPYTTSFDHGFGESLLVLGIWSEDSAFNSTHTCAMLRYSGDPVIVWSTKSKVFVTNYAGNTRPVYVRIYALLKSDSIASATPTSSYSNKYIFSSDFRYMPLVQTFTASRTTTYSHNLGYKPRVLAWIEYTNDVDGHTEPLMEGSPSSYNAGVQSILVTNSTIQVKYPASGTAPGVVVHGRIYG